MVNASARLLRGSGYVAFDGETPAEPQHAALASEYAHVTAPLRRLGDRYAGEVCLALCAGDEVPDWVRAALPGLPAMLRSVLRPGRRLRARGPRPGRGRRAPAPRSGPTFAGVVVDVDEKDAAPRRRGARTTPDVEARVVCRVAAAARHRRDGAAHRRRRRGAEGRVRARQRLSHQMPALRQVANATHAA